MDIKKSLLKEAISRTPLAEKEFNTILSKNEHNFANQLLKESVKKLEKVKLAELEKESMAAQAGVKDVRNSTANTVFDSPVFSENSSNLENKLYEAYSKYFYTEFSGKKLPTDGGVFIPETPGSPNYKKVPNSHFRIEFPFHRSIMPSVPEFAGNAEDTLNILDTVVPGFSSMISALEESGIPVIPYFHSTVRSINMGGINTKEAMSFIQEEYKKKATSATLKASPIANFFYEDLMRRQQQGKPILLTLQYPHNRKYNNEFAKDLNVPAYILKAITHKIENGYKVNWKAFSKDLQGQINRLVAASTSSGMDKAALAEKRKAYSAYYKNIYETIRKTFSDAVSQAEDKTDEWYSVKGKRGFRVKGKGTKHVMPQDIPVAYLKLALYHMTEKYKNANTDLKPDEFTIPGHKLTYASNGMDSVPTNQNESMPVFPSIRKYPNGNVWYDTDQCNLGRTHLVHNGKNVESVLSKYGSFCENAVKKLSAASDSQIANLQHSRFLYDAWKVVFRNRTNAETILEILSYFNDYPSFRDRFLNKSLASGYTGGRGAENVQSLQGSMLTQQGFLLLKKYGYVVSKIMDFISAIAHSTSKETITSREDNGQQVVEKFHGRTLSTSTGKAKKSSIIIGLRYANTAPILGSNHPELQSLVEKKRKRQGVGVGQEGEEYVRQTQHPQRATPLPGVLQQNSTYTIIHDLRFFVGLATSQADFQKAIGADDYDTWDKAVNVLLTRYPQIESEVGAIIEPMNVNLKDLSNKFKRALARVQKDIKDKHLTFVVDDKVSNSTTVIDEHGVDAEQDISRQESQVSTITSPQKNLYQPQVPQGPPTSPASPTSVPFQPPNEAAPINPSSVPAQPAMPAKNEIAKPFNSKDYVGRRDNSKRSLIRNRPNENSGKLRRSDILESLIKVANKLDKQGEILLASKIDFIIKKISKDNINVD